MENPIEIAINLTNKKLLCNINITFKLSNNDKNKAFILMSL